MLTLDGSNFLCARKGSVFLSISGSVFLASRLTRAKRRARLPGYCALACTSLKAISTTSSGRTYTVYSSRPISMVWRCSVCQSKAGRVAGVQPPTFGQTVASSLGRAVVYHHRARLTLRHQESGCLRAVSLRFRRPQELIVSRR